MLSPISMAAALGYWGVYKFLRSHLTYFEDFVPWYHASAGVSLSDHLSQGLKSFVYTKYPSEMWLFNGKMVSTYATSRDVSSISNASYRYQNWQRTLLEQSDRKRDFIKNQLEDITTRLLKNHTSLNQSPTRAVKLTTGSLFELIEKKPKDQDKSLRTIDLRGFNELPPHARMSFLKTPIKVLATEIQEFQKAGSIEELILWMGVDELYSEDLRPYVKEYLKIIYPTI